MTDSPPPAEPQSGAAAGAGALAVRPGWPAAAALPWLLVLLAFALLAILPRFPGPGVDADDYAQYLMHAQALADGRPFGDILYIHTRLNPWVGPAQTPPGLPALLAPVLRFVGRAGVPWAMLALALAMLALFARYIREQDERPVALGTLLLCALSPTLIFAGPQALTDLPLMAVVWAMAILVDRPGVPSAGHLVALAALGCAAFALRSAAMALVPTLVLLAFLRRREGGWRLLVPVLAWAAIGVVALLAGDLHRILLIRLNPGGVLARLADLHVLRHKLRIYGGAFLDSQLQPLPVGAVALAYHVLATGLVLVGAYAWVRQRPKSFVNAFALTYGLMLLLLPFMDGRYFWPMLPLVLFLMVKGVRVLALRFLAPDAAARVALVAVLVLALGGLADVARQHRPVGLGQTPRGRELFAFLRRTSAREPMRVTFAKPRVLAWELGIPAMGGVGSKPQLALGELCRKRITHVIVSDLLPDGFVRRLAADRPQNFVPVFTNAKYSVFQLRGDLCAGAVPTPAPAAPGVAE